MHGLVFYCIIYCYFSTTLRTQTQAIPTKLWSSTAEKMHISLRTNRKWRRSFSRCLAAILLWDYFTEQHENFSRELFLTWKFPDYGIPSLWVHENGVVELFRATLKKPRIVIARSPWSTTKRIHPSNVNVDERFNQIVIAAKDPVCAC